MIHTIWMPGLDARATLDYPKIARNLLSCGKHNFSSGIEEPSQWTIKRPLRRTLMHAKVSVLICFAVAASILSAPECAHAGDLKINIPKRSILTPVQRLNREGVEAVRKCNFKKAEELFYKAYLFDPDDAFTLNNLGYISELQGDVDRAQRFYELASVSPSDAVVDMASAAPVKGRPMREAVAVATGPLQTNHANVEAVRLLGQRRAAEADVLLQQALKADPRNVFTLNNLGAAKEMEGEEEEALRYYDQAAGLGTGSTAIVTTDRTWKGRPMSDMAQANAKALRSYIAHRQGQEDQVAELNLRGVSAVNRNDLRSAEADFRRAYALDPNNAFALNNIGYVSEMTGDKETAQFFYQLAREAMGASANVGVASRATAEGQKLFAVAEDNNGQVTTKVSQERDILRRENEPVVLRRRDNSVVDEPSQPAPSPDSNPQR
jgi:Flp pilus assembly protein TadD